MASPRPLPTAIKRLRGKPGHHPLNEREPQPEIGVPSCPRWLEGEARAEWRRMGKLLANVGVMTHVDRAIFAVYCQTYGRWVEMEKKLRNTGGPVVETDKGNMIQNPHLSVANRAMEQMLKAAIEFGMTPSSRNRIKVGEKPDVGLADILFGIPVEVADEVDA